MSKVTLYYFQAKAAVEGIRTLLAYGGQEFEDRRLEFGEEWLKFKPNTPLGTLPVLNIDGKEYATCLAISRYLGKKYGLIGDNDEEAFEIDQNVDYITDMRQRASTTYWERDEEIKKKQQEENAKLYPAMLDKINAMLEKNDGYIAAKKLTWADFHFAGMLDYLKVILQMPDLTDKYPAFKKIAERVYSIPKVKAWAATAPHTEL
ncbi:glutathione S-transferase 2-like [Anticarsia gemmatalis]|uniref:glutathione S-transferase 2-like n=1 Tax=Anticarsia gemmatalis TaxID=129554 RepID=UPI003F7721D5